MSQFNSKSESRGVSLPEDMWSYVRSRAAREGRSLSNFLQRLIEDDARNHAETSLIDAKVPYVVEHSRV